MTQKELEKLYISHYDKLISFSKNWIRVDIAICHDIVVDAFINVYQNHKAKLLTNSQLRSYLFISVRNGCFDWIRKNKKNAQTSFDSFFENILEDSSHNDMRNKLIEEIVIDFIRQNIKTLPTQARLVMEYFLSGMSPLEIAEKMGISHQNVLNQKARGVLLLRKILSAHSILGIKTA